MRRCARAWTEIVIGGIETTIPLHQRLSTTDDVPPTAITTSDWLDRFLAGSP